MSWRLEENTLAKFEGSQLDVVSHQYLLISLFSEKMYPELCRRQAVFLGQRTADGLSAVIKLLIQNNPRLNPEGDTSKWATRLFEEEVQALSDCKELRSTPNLLDHDRQVQDIRFEYPGGYLHIIAMSRMPGKPVTEYTDLSDSEGLYIKSQLMQILEDIRQHGWYIHSGVPDKVIYDRSIRAVSMTSLGNSVRCDPSKPEKYPFTEKNDILHGFGQDMWWM